MANFKGTHFEATVILPCVRWYFTFPLSARQLAAMMQERGVAVDYSTVLDSPRLGADLVGTRNVPGDFSLDSRSAHRYYPIRV
jgi:hypothetical protein